MKWIDKMLSPARTTEIVQSGGSDSESRRWRGESARKKLFDVFIYNSAINRDNLIFSSWLLVLKAKSRAIILEINALNSSIENNFAAAAALPKTNG